MRIVDVCGFFSPRGGGVRTYIQQKLKQSAHFGCDMTILAPGSCNDVQEVSPRARIRTLTSAPFLLDRKYHSFVDEAAVHDAIDRIGPDIIEASSPWNSAEYVASYPMDTPRALVMHSDPLSAHAYRWFDKVAQPETVDRLFQWFWHRLRRYGFNFDAIVTANANLRSRLENGGVRSVVTIPMGVEPEVFSPCLYDPDLRRRLLTMCDLDHSATLLVCAGRLATEKRIPMLVDAVATAGRVRPVGLVVFGEGRARGKILRRVCGNPHIRLMQPIRDRTHFASILASADALVHGCEAETFGMTVAEAQASGTPIIAPDTGGTRDFLGADPQLGFRANQVDDVVRAILALPRSRQRREPMKVRSMGDHFEDLFGLYRDLRLSRSVQVA